MRYFELAAVFWSFQEHTLPVKGESDSKSQKIDCHCFRDPVLQLLLHHNYTKRQQTPCLWNKQQCAMLIGGIRSWLPICSFYCEKKHRADQPFHLDFMQNRFTKCLALHMSYPYNEDRVHIQTTLKKEVFFRNTKSHKGVCPKRKTWFFHFTFLALLHWRPELQVSGSDSSTHVKPVPPTPLSGECQRWNRYEWQHIETKPNQSLLQSSTVLVE